jgi:F420-dependent oxidoreductase-like protein
MKIGLQIPRFDWPGGTAEMGATLGRIGRSADAAGFASIWVMDHFFQIEYVGKAEEPMLESYTTLGFLAGSTTRARLGTMVTGVNYRPPGYLIKQVTALDVLSGGRAWLGIGAGWFEREAVGLGLPFPPLKERFERLEETLQIAHQMWAGDVTPIHTKHYDLAEPISSPQPLTQPHPPILIGGGGEQKTLRMVAQYGDACNLFGHLGPQGLTHKLDVLKRHCDEIGRDYATIERTILLNVPGGNLEAAAIVEQCRSMAAIGFQHAIYSALPGVETLAPLDFFGREVIPAVAEL